MKLTLEIDVPDDQLPPNATGRLLWKYNEIGDYVVLAKGGVSRATTEYAVPSLVIETREPWRVPEHLRHPAWNGCESKRRVLGSLLYRSGNGSWIAQHTHSMLRLSDSDVEQMIPEHVYKLGEDAE